MAMTDLELDVELLKKEVDDMKVIHGRLDTAITKITDVSNCINRMYAFITNPTTIEPPIIRYFHLSRTPTLLVTSSLNLLISLSNS